MNKNFLEIYWTDVYKVGHQSMLPVGSVLMQSNFTPRGGKYSNSPNEGKIVSFGQQMTVRKIKRDWDENFFSMPIEEIDQFGQDMTDMLMLDEPMNVEHFKALHRLGYLPIEFRSIEEGELLPYRVPFYTIVNTKPLNGTIVDWLVNYLETILSAESWQAPTSATLSYSFRQLGLKWAMKTDPNNLWFVDYQFHDFSMRGMGGKSAIVNSSLGFATSSRGSDSLPVIPAARKYYDETAVCINSVIASEHAIMCALTGFFLRKKDGTWEKIGELEVETFRYLLKLFPKGILSLVSDTWNIWRVICEYCVILKDEILARNGKLVIRPDSGDPVDIVTGVNTVPSIYLSSTATIIHNNTYPESIVDTPAWKGVIEILWDVFGGSVNDKGYKVLDSHIGAIYGDSINYDRAKRIFERLESKGFASTNIVLGVGSYSLQYVTRDTHSFAQKATYVEIEFNGIVEGIEIFKDPVTDDGTKKSAKGLLMVIKDENGEYQLKDQCTMEEVNSDKNEMKIIFKDGKFYNQTTLTRIREKLMAV